jgi:GNAT superfamily N-acetyltransferase
MSIEGKTRSSRSEDTFEIEISRFYTAEDKNDLAEGEEDPSQTRPYKLQWRPTDTHVFLSARGKRQCHVGIVEQIIEIGGTPTRIAGIGGVLARKESRGCGYGRLTMEAAEDFARREMGVEFILLFCRPVVKRWYDLLGWANVCDAVWADQPEGEVRIPLVAMTKSLGTNPWPQGEVHLRSRPW